MTGIERLRELVDGISPITALCGVTKSSYDRSHIETVGARLRDFLADIADQIEREQDKVAKTDWDTVRKVSADMADRVFMSATIDELLRDWSRKLNDATDGHVASDSHEARAPFSRMRVLAVVTDMERHVLGHEGMDDSPVARWARELREALGGRGEEVTDVATIRKDAYDAYEWVEANGGLDAVKRRWECLSYYADPVPRSCMDKRLARLQRQIDESHAALRRRNEMLKRYEEANEELLERAAAMKRRLMPEGMEWPRYESGEPFIPGEDGSVEFFGDGIFNVWINGDHQHLIRGERVKRPDSLERLAEDISAMVVAWRSNRDLFDAQEAAAGCVGENTLGAALDYLVRRAKALAERERGE